MPLYRSISKVVLGDGERIGFWMDDWAGCGALCHALPALFSHATHPHTSVAAVVRGGLRRALAPRLSAVGEREFTALLPRVEALQLSGQPDSRILTMCAKRTGELAVGELYKLMQFGGVDAPFADFVWGGFAPSKAKFFAWLLVQSRIQSRAALFKKHVLSEEEALCPICESERETATHLIFACSFVRRFWDAIGWSFPVDADVRRLFSYDTPAPRGSKTTSTLTILLCWNIWKHRNRVAFRGERASLPRLLSMCREDAALWELRAPAALHDEAVAWPSLLGTV
jgi:hypothetical protein